MLRDLDTPDLRLEIEAETAQVTQIWKLEAQDARMERERRVTNGETGGPRVKTEDALGKNREECASCSCHYSVESGVGTSKVSFVLHLMKSSTYTVQFDDAEDSTVVERNTGGSKDGGEIRGTRSTGLGVDARPTREFAWKTSDQSRGCNVGTQTKQEVWSVERLRGRMCWVVKRGDRSKRRNEDIKR